MNLQKLLWVVAHRMN